VRGLWLVAASAVAVSAFTALSRVPAHVLNTQESQYDASAQIITINGQSAGGQPFVPASSAVTNFSAYLQNHSNDTGETTVFASIRPGNDRARAPIWSGAKALATGWGGGWVRFDDLRVPVTAGSRYYLVLQASHADHSPIRSGTVIWDGRSGGDATGLAFAVNTPSADDCAVSATPDADDCLPARVMYVTDSSRSAGVLGHVPGTPPGSTNPYISVTTSQSFNGVSGEGMRFIPGADVMQLRDGSVVYVPPGAAAPVVGRPSDPAVVALEHDDAAFLAAGTVPGTDNAQIDASRRALLDMRSLTAPNGASGAAADTYWSYTWPRDSAWTAAAFAMTGHSALALSQLRFDQRVQRADGSWAARVSAGGVVPDKRVDQWDDQGWIPWATYVWYSEAPAAGRAADLASLYPMVEKAADFAIRHQQSNGLISASSDYFEVPESAIPLGEEAPILSGLRAAAALATAMGDTADHDAFISAANRLSAGITNIFGANHYTRHATDAAGYDPDMAVAWLDAPFAPESAPIDSAMNTTFAAIQGPVGGIKPSRIDFGNAWCPETAAYALGYAASGQTSTAQELVTWLLAHRGPSGSLPEQVDNAGNPSSVTPLAWTSAAYLLTVSQLSGRAVPIPPTS
jgi:hypothetical protein